METGTAIGSRGLVSLGGKLPDHLKNACCDELKVQQDSIKDCGDPKGKEVTLSGSGTDHHLC